MTIISHTISQIQATDKSLTTIAQAHLDNLTKPQGSLGQLEVLAKRLFLINAGQPPQVDPARIYTCAADHGVAQAGVSLFPQEVTRQMVNNFLNKGAAINVLSQSAGIDLKVVDCGCLGGKFSDHPALIQNKIQAASGDISIGPAMSVENCQKAVELGIDLAKQAREQGFNTVGTGEMGIANTTPATALYAAYLNIDPREITGPGTGLNQAGVKKKIDTIINSLTVNAQAVASGDGLKILSTLGGLEIATLTGLILGAAARRMQIVIDGFISTSALVAAWKICPPVLDYCFFAHSSAEPGHKKILQALQAQPILDLGLRLGEGTGAALAIFILRCAADIYNKMASFEQAQVDR